MAIVLATNWWALVLRGVAAILFGVIAYLIPGVTLSALILVFAAYALADGVLSVIAAVRREPGERHWYALLLEGVVGILAAAAAIFWPAMTAVALVYLIAAWAILTGALEIVAAVRLRKQIRGEVLLGLCGLASIGLGVLLFASPAAGALAVVLWLGAYAFIFGALLIALGVRVRRFGRVPAGMAVR